MIRRLDQDVCSKIAAGEVIHSPWNVIKEMIENSLDAKASSISVILRDGGYSGIQVIDNGNGIQKDDLPLLCQRFATSKITKFSDLHKISTFGFRGEALASISQVSHVNVLTRIPSQEIAYKAEYVKGDLKEEPQIASGNVGTVIKVENLFYNLKKRVKYTSKSYNDEYARILDLLQNYSIFYFQVQFNCKKAGSSNPDLRAVVGESTSQLNLISQIFGSNVARNLSPINIETLPDFPETSIRGYVSTVGYQGSKRRLVIFVNGRLVENARLKRVIDNIYALHLLKGRHPFVYLEINVPARMLDVNLHPSKMEVLLENEVEISDAISQTLDSMLKSNESSEVASITVLKPVVATKENHPAILNSPNYNNSNVTGNGKSPSSMLYSSESKKPRYDFQLNRTDFKSKTLEEFISPFKQHQSSKKPIKSSLITPIDVSEGATDKNPPRAIERDDSITKSGHNFNPCQIKNESKISDRCYVDVQLESIKSIKESIKMSADNNLKDILQTHVFVGFASDKWIIIQDGIKLYILQYHGILEDFIFQQCVENFANFGEIAFEKPINIRSCLSSLMTTSNQQDGKGSFENDFDASNYDELDEALDGISWKSICKSSNELIEHCLGLLEEKSEMIFEYFQIDIKEGNLLSLPLIVDGLMPNPGNIAIFLLRVALLVDWKREEACFRGICRELAIFYSPKVSKDVEKDYKDKNLETFAIDSSSNDEKWLIQYAIFPAIKTLSFYPSKSTIYHEVASLHDLYKVFERC